MTRELEQSAYSAWRLTQKSKMTYGIASELMRYFTRAGFDCRSPWIIETVPICVTSAFMSQGEINLSLK